MTEKFSVTEEEEDQTTAKTATTKGTHPVEVTITITMTKESDKKTKVFEPHSVGMQPTDKFSAVLEDILLKTVNCKDDKRFIESIREEKCMMEKETPKPPGSLDVNPNTKVIWNN